MKRPKMSLSKTVFSLKCHLPNAEKPSNYGLFCSNAVRTLAPRRSKLRIACSDFFQKSERARSAAPPFKIEPTSLGFNFVLFGFISVNAVRTLAPASSRTAYRSRRRFFVPNKRHLSLTSSLLLSKLNPLTLGFNFDNNRRGELWRCKDDQKLRSRRI